LRFSVLNGILRISSKRGDYPNAVFCPPENEPKKVISNYVQVKVKFQPRSICSSPMSRINKSFTKRLLIGAF
jgi:hypothetical protein